MRRDFQRWAGRAISPVPVRVRDPAVDRRALFHPVSRSLLGAGARLLPGAMSWIAAATRVPPGALRRAGLAVLH